MTFNCRTNTSNPLRWNYYTHDTDSVKRLYSGARVHPDFIDRIQVTFDALEGIGTLNINNALLTDAGTYECLEQYSTVNAILFQLVAGKTCDAWHTLLCKCRGACFNDVKRYSGKINPWNCFRVNWLYAVGPDLIWGASITERIRTDHFTKSMW